MKKKKLLEGHIGMDPNFTKTILQRVGMTATETEASSIL